MPAEITVSDLDEILALVQDYQETKENVTTGLKNGLVAKSKQKSIPPKTVIEKITPPERMKVFTGRAGFFPCKIPIKFSNNHCVYRLDFGDRFIFVKCKFFQQSIIQQMKDLDRKIRLGCEPTHMLYKVTAFVTGKKIKNCTATILFQPVNPEDMIDFEKNILLKHSTDPKCLNMTFEPYIPKWISEIDNPVEKKPSPLPAATAELIIEHSNNLYEKKLTEKVKSKKPKDIVNFEYSSRPFFTPEYISAVTAAFELQMTKSNDLVIQQFTYHKSVMDFALIKNNIVTEVEIKASIGDYWNDFQKLISNGRYLLNKHNMIKNGKYIANHFYFLCPNGVIKESEIPSHCGFIIADRINEEATDFKFTVVKSAPITHSGYAGESFYKTLSKNLLNLLKNARVTIKSLSELINATEKEKLHKNKPSDQR